THGRVRLAQRGGRRADALEQETYPLLQAAAADAERITHGLEADVLESRRVENPAHAIRVGEREGAGRARRRWRGQLDVLRRRRERHQQPGGVGGRPPAAERYAAAGPERAAQIAERGRRIPEEHHAETGEEEVCVAGGEA